MPDLRRKAITMLVREGRGAVIFYGTDVIWLDVHRHDLDREFCKEQLKAERKFP